MHSAHHFLFKTFKKITLLKKGIEFYDKKSNILKNDNIL